MSLFHHFTLNIKLLSFFFNSITDVSPKSRDCMDDLLFYERGKCKMHGKNIFFFPSSRIRIHEWFKENLIHSWLAWMKFCDGSSLAQYGRNDVRVRKEQPAHYTNGADS